MLHPRLTSLFFLLGIMTTSGIVHSQETRTWTNHIPAGGWPNTTLGPHSDNTTCHSRGSLTAEVTNPNGVIIFANTPRPTPTNNNSLILGMSSAPATQGLTTSLTFTYPVENITFSIFDIDGNTSSWQDRFIISASLGGTNTTVTTTTCPSAAGTVCTSIGGGAVQIDAGTTPTGFTSAAGRADITISGSADSISIQYLNHTVPVSSTQFISITELTYDCAILGVSKEMTIRAGQVAGVSPYIVDIDFNFENFGDVTLSNLTAPDDLDAVFNIPPNVANFTVSSISKTSGPGSFTENASFNGSGDQELIAAGSSLAPGQTASIRVTLNITNYGFYTNAIQATGTTPASATTNDDSTDGTDADGSDADNNPDETSPTTIDTSLLPVSLNYFSSQKNDESLSLQWQTDIEFEHLGFKIYQQDDFGKKLDLSNIIHQANKQTGQALKTYTVNIASYNDNPIWLAEINTKGSEILYGPFNVNSISGSKIQHSKIVWEETHLLQKQTSTNNTSLAINVSETGMHRITYSDLLQAGLNLLDTKPINIRIALENSAIPIFINGNVESFDNSTSFDFYAKNINTLYTDKRVYKLSLNQEKSPRILMDNTGQSSVIKAWYLQTEHYNPNIIYDFSSPTNDPWRAEQLATFGTNEKNLQFPLDELSQIADKNVMLKLEVSGGLNYETIPEVYPSNPDRCGANHLDLYPGMPNDHCIKLNVNNTPYDDLVFDGLTNYKTTYQLDSSATETGAVNINLSLPGETGFDHDVVNIEDIALTYPRNLTAINNALQFTIGDQSKFTNDMINQNGFEKLTNLDTLSLTNNNKAAIEATGFTSNNIVAYALSSGAPIRIANTEIDSHLGEYSVSIPSISQQGKYWLSTEQSLIKPTLANWHNSSNISFSNIDYIIISHKDFMDTSLQLKEYHQSKGLNVALVNVEDIYEKYSASIIDPYAIKDYIADIGKTNPLKYILLIGSDNYDYKGYISDQHISHIPSIYTAVDDIVRYAPSDSLLADIDNDNIPDIAIGRLPVRTNTELQLLIDKQMNYISKASSGLTAHFIADAADEQHSYAQISNQLSAQLPETWSIQSTNRDDYVDADTTKQQILDNFALNPRLTTYLGHSGPRNWFSFPSAFTYNDIVSLDNNDSASVILQWGCWNSYYVEPDANTMAHRFLFDSEKGGVAVFGASALTSVNSEKAFAEYIINELAKPKQTIGISMLKAKQALASRGDYKDIIIGWNLLGDPALTLGVSE